MKKIGILHGKERSFPAALIERINAIGNTLADLSERTNALRGYL